MRRFALAAVLALLVAACGGGGNEVVATVGGTDITLAEVEGLRATDAGAVPRDQFNEDLRNAIVEVAVVQAAEERLGISVTEEEVEQRYQELVAQIEEQTGESFDAFLEAQGFSEDRIRRIAHQQLVGERVQEQLAGEAGPVTEEEVQAEYARQELARTEACVQHVLVETEEEAQAVVDRLEAGEELGTVAQEVSIDPSAGENAGDLGCATLGNYVAEFAQAAFDAEIGEVVGPVRSQFGYHVLVVESRETTPLEEAREEIVAQLETTRGSELFREWLLEVVSAAEVEVDAEYGQWSTTPVPQILPPQ